MIYNIEDTKVAAPLFEGWEETMIWSCLQRIMGQIYADSLEMPDSAMASLGDFCFFAGRPNKELVLYNPTFCKQDFRIMIPQDEPWGDLIADCYGQKAKRMVRYAIRKEKDIFDRKRLSKIVDALPWEYTLQSMDEALFWECKKIAWCQDFVSQYRDFSMYQKYGLGVVIKKAQEIVSGASSYSGYQGGIEIEIDTKEEYRRRGLAASCGAKLILECFNRGWYPSWDAQNTWSLALAEKLGYHFEHAYTAYEIKKE